MSSPALPGSIGSLVNLTMQHSHCLEGIVMEMRTEEGCQSYCLCLLLVISLQEINGPGEASPSNPHSYVGACSCLWLTPSLAQRLLGAGAFQLRLNYSSRDGCLAGAGLGGLHGTEIITVTYL